MTFVFSFSFFGFGAPDVLSLRLRTMIDWAEWPPATTFRLGARKAAVREGTRKDADVRDVVDACRVLIGSHWGRLDCRCLRLGEN